MSFGTVRRQIATQVGAGERAVALVTKAAIRGVVTRLGGDPTKELITAGHFKNTGESCQTIHVRIGAGKLNRVTGVGPFEKLVKAAAQEGKVVEFIGDPMSQFRTGRSLTGRAFRQRTGIYGLKAEEAYLWNLDGNEKVNLATGEVLPVPPELVAQAKAELGL